MIKWKATGEPIPLSYHVFSLCLLLGGIACGSLLMNDLSLQQRETLALYVQQFFFDAKPYETMSRSAVWLDAWQSYLLYAGSMWLLGYSIIGMPLVFFLLFLKGATMGVALSFFLSQYGASGFGLAVVATIGQNIWLVPLLVYVTSASLQLTLELLRRYFHVTARLQKSAIAARYTSIVVLIVVIVTIASTVEAWLTPFFIEYMIRFIK